MDASLQNKSSNRDIITVVNDPRHCLGKIFTYSEADQAIYKQSAVSVSIAEAVQYHVPDIQALELLLKEVSENNQAAIINSAFPLIPVGERFLIYSENEFQKLGIKRRDPSISWPVMINYGGKSMPALGRFKEHTTPSSWLLLDRDIDEHTPKKFADLTYEEWLVAVDKLMPGILKCARLRAYSASSRVSFDGKPVGGGNGHTWIQLEKPDDLDRLRSVIKARALELDMTWSKPRYSRTTGEMIGNSVVSIIDWSVFTTGRLVFVGKPEVRHEI